MPYGIYFHYIRWFFIICGGYIIIRGDLFIIFGTWSVICGACCIIDGAFLSICGINCILRGNIFIKRGACLTMCGG